MSDIVNYEDIRFELYKLVRSNYKQQLCEYILDRIGIVDATYNYHNVEILKMIGSRWVWDNVIPYMAECIHRDTCDQHKRKGGDNDDYCKIRLQVKLLPERRN